MKLHEYINKAKEQLDDMYLKYIDGHEKDPANWPLEMDEEEWIEQELAIRELS